MKRSAFGARVAVVAAGSLLLTGVASAAFAVDDSDGVAVNVDIAPINTGALTLTVANDSTSLTEQTSADPDAREFVGTLPTVTVSDTRDPSAIPANKTGADGKTETTGWYVLGQASAFTKAGSTDTIGPENLGWTPDLLNDGNGTIAQGDETVPALDEPTSSSGEEPNNVGLADKELLAIATSSKDARATGTTWSAKAALKLKTPKTVAPGAYTSTLTLSLFE